MEPSVVLKPAMHLLGVESRYSSPEAAGEQDPGFMKVWLERFMPNRPAIAHLAIGTSHYCLTANYPDGSCTYMVSLLTSDLTNEKPPESFEYRNLPAGLYAIFQMTPREMGTVEQEKKAHWLKHHPELAYDPHRYSVEEYPAECTGADGIMYSWMPVRRVM